MINLFLCHFLKHPGGLFPFLEGLVFVKKAATEPSVFRCEIVTALENSQSHILIYDPIGLIQPVLRIGLDHPDEISYVPVIVFYLNGEVVAIKGLSLR